MNSEPLSPDEIATLNYSAKEGLIDDEVVEQLLDNPVEARAYLAQGEAMENDV